MPSHAELFCVSHHFIVFLTTRTTDLATLLLKCSVALQAERSVCLFLQDLFLDLDDFMHDIIGVCSLLLWFSKAFGVITQSCLPGNLQHMKNDVQCAVALVEESMAWLEK